MKRLKYNAYLNGKKLWRRPKAHARGTWRIWMTWAGAIDLLTKDGKVVWSRTVGWHCPFEALAFDAE